MFLFLEALIDAGEEVGLPREAAERLAIQTVYGAAKARVGWRQAAPRNSASRCRRPAEPRSPASPQLDEGGLRDILARAVAAATRRSVRARRELLSAAPRARRPLKIPGSSVDPLPQHERATRRRQRRNTPAKLEAGLRITPLDIRNHGFPRTISGYARDEVDAFPGHGLR